MSDSTFLDKFANIRKGGQSALDVSPDDEPFDDFGCFGWLRGIGDRSTMLQCKKKDGTVLALGYGWLERAQFDPSQGITLHVTGQDVQIIGRNLNHEVRQGVRLFDGITKHRVPFLCEASNESALRAPDSACVIEEIRW